MNPNRNCAENHPLIEWFNPAITKCPLCEAREALASAQKTIEALRVKTEYVEVPRRLPGVSYRDFHCGGWCPP
jgi:hypothetical protein